MSTKKKSPEPSYAELSAELEKILDEIESGEIDLDELSDKVERAATLLSQCRKKLAATETKVKKVTLNPEWHDERKVFGLERMTYKGRGPPQPNQDWVDVANVKSLLIKVWDKDFVGDECKAHDLLFPDDMANACGRTFYFDRSWRNCRRDDDKKVFRLDTSTRKDGCTRDYVFPLSTLRFMTRRPC